MKTLQAVQIEIKPKKAFNSIFQSLWSIKGGIEKSHALSVSIIMMYVNCTGNRICTEVIWNWLLCGKVVALILLMFWSFIFYAVWKWRDMSSLWTCTDIEWTCNFPSVSSSIGNYSWFSVSRLIWPCFSTGYAGNARDRICVECMSNYPLSIHVWKYICVKDVKWN